MKTFFIILSALVFSTALAHAGCELVQGGSKKAFDGKSLRGLSVEKKSLMLLNRAFPSLNLIEHTFKGEVITCTSCLDNYVTCHD